MIELHTYDGVPVSSPSLAEAFAPEREGWAAVPRPMLIDWLAVLSRAARVVAPDYAAPDLPDPVAFDHETIASDGPYGSNENFYYLGYYSIRLSGLLIHFEYGRHEGGEPLCMETTGLPHNLASYMSPKLPGVARVFAWHEPELAPVVRRGLGLR